MPDLRIFLEPHEIEALKALAKRELRDYRAQALLIIRQELERRGLLAAPIELSPVPIEAYEYLTSWFDDFDTSDHVNEWLDERGRDGWRLVNTVIDRGQLAVFMMRSLNHPESIKEREEWEELGDD